MNYEFYIATALFGALVAVVRLKFNQRHTPNKRRRVPGAIIGAVIAISYCLYFLAFKNSELDLYFVLSGLLAMLFTMLLGVIGVSQSGYESEVNDQLDV